MADRDPRQRPVSPVETQETRAQPSPEQASRAPESSARADGSTPGESPALEQSATQKESAPREQSATRKDSTTLEEKGFSAVGRLTAPGERGSKLADSALAPLMRRFDPPPASWRDEANQAINEAREPGARGLLFLALAIFILLLSWAALAPIDEVTRGQGKVIPAHELQVVQSSDGGVIQQIHISEGDRVEKGDVLVNIDPTRSIASEKESRVRMFALQARIDRLNALIDGTPWTPTFNADLSDDQRQVLQQELEYFKESRDGLKQRLNGARQQLDQRKQALTEAQAKKRSAGQSRRLVAKELNVTRPLLESGAVSEVEVLRLERDLSSARGELEQARAEVEQRKSAVDEARSDIDETRHKARNRWRSQLSEASSERQSLEESVVALADRVKATTLRAPVSGTVQRVLYNTSGGFVARGDPVVEIVPEDDRLVVEAKIAPRDIAFLKPGLPTSIKLNAYDFSIYGGVKARLEHISADTITDDQDRTYYEVRASTDAQNLSEELAIIPGMTAQVDITTGKRTVLQYLLKPILRAKANALGER